MALVSASVEVKNTYLSGYCFTSFLDVTPYVTPWLENLSPFRFKKHLFTISCHSYLRPSITSRAVPKDSTFSRVKHKNDNFSQ